MIGHISHSCFFLYLANGFLVIFSFEKFSAVHCKTTSSCPPLPPSVPPPTTANCLFWLRMQRGGRSWREMHQLPVLCIWAACQAPATKRLPAAHSAETPALGGGHDCQGWTSQHTVAPSCSGGLSIRTFIGNTRPGKAPESPSLSREGGILYRSLTRGVQPH